MIPREEGRESQAVSVAQEDEIDLREVWRTLLRNKKFILKVTLAAALLSALASLLMHDIYRAEVLVSSAQGSDKKGGGLASALSGLGGVAALAGISLGGGGSEEAIAVLQSKKFLWEFAQSKNLLPILFEAEWDEEKQKWKSDDPKDQPGQMELYRLMDGILSVEKDKKTELITVAVEWKDPELAAEWANGLVEAVNRHLAQQEIERSQRNLKYLNEELMNMPVEEMRKTLFDLIASEQKKAMVANTQPDFAFKVLDQAVVPDKKIRPKRSIIVLMATFLALIISMIIAYVRGRGESVSSGER